MQVVVIRQQFNEDVERVIIVRDTETDRDAVTRTYPTAEFYRDGMFRIPDSTVPRYTTEYLYDTVNAE